jgi:eukaryotic-like serine/threonine-protein kinase
MNNLDGLDTAQLKEVSRILDELLSLDPDARSAKLAEVKAYDISLALALESLLNAHHNAEDDAFLETGWQSPLLRTDAPNAATPPESFGPYRVSELIAKGGMSEIWLAHRADGTFDRPVAIKMLAGLRFDSHAAARLAAEAKVLAKLEHPNVARLIDAGALESGTPYLVLEYIAGSDIATFADAQQLGIARRIRLFQQLCAAIAFLHQNVIVHRDVKPSNVLVTADGVVKLVDFGIAKSLVPFDTIDGSVTRIHGLAYTPEYAAPEQWLGGRITTATDVYGLGQVLYRLLSGCTPYGEYKDRDDLRARTLETEAPSTSSWWGPHGKLSFDEKKRLSASRDATPARIFGELKGDVDAIIAKSIARDPRERYSNAEALAEDLTALLEGRPIRAREWAVPRKISRFVSRHRGSIAVASVVMVALGSAIGFGLWQGYRSGVESARANRILAAMTTLLREANPNSHGGKLPTVVDVLARAPEIAEKEFASDPQFSIRLLKQTSTILLDLTEPDQALRHLSVLAKLARLHEGEGGTTALEARSDYAEALGVMGRLDDALSEQVEIRAILERDGHNKTGKYVEVLVSIAQTLDFLQRRSEAAETGLQALAMMDSARELTPHDRLLARFHVLSVLGGAYRVREAVALAESIERENSTPLLEPTERINKRSVLAATARVAGQLQKARNLLDENIAETVRAFGSDNLQVSSRLTYLGALLTELGEFPAAGNAFEQVMAIESKHRADDHWYRGHLHTFYVRLHLLSGNLSAAKQELGKAKEAFGQVAREPHVDYIDQRASFELLSGNASKALVDFSFAYDMRVKQFGGPREPAPALSAVLVGNAERLAGRPADAVQRIGEALGVLEPRLLPGDYRVAKSRLYYALALLEANRIAEASDAAEKANAALVQALPASHPLLVKGRDIADRILRSAPGRIAPAYGSSTKIL